MSDEKAAIIARQWRVRRRMAVISFFLAALGFPILHALYPHIKDIAAAYYTFSTFIVTAYIGAATWQDVKQK